MTTNQSTSYQSWIFSYPFLWLKWQRKILGSWFDIWAKTTPTVVDSTGQSISLQEQFVKSLFEIEEKTIQVSLETQKLFWQNYFQVLQTQKSEAEHLATETTATLEQFPTSARTY